MTSMVPSSSCDPISDTHEHKESLGFNRKEANFGILRLESQDLNLNPGFATLLSVGPCTSHLNFLCFSFFIYKKKKVRRLDQLIPKIHFQLWVYDLIIFYNPFSVNVLTAIVLLLLKVRGSLPSFQQHQLNQKWY